MTQSREAFISQYVIEHLPELLRLVIPEVEAWLEATRAQAACDYEALPPQSLLLGQWGPNPSIGRIVHVWLRPAGPADAPLEPVPAVINGTYPASRHVDVLLFLPMRDFSHVLGPYGDTARLQRLVQCATPMENRWSWPQPVR